MSTHKHIDRICAAVVVLCVVLTVVLSCAAAGTEPGGITMGYENRLFDTSRVHTIDILLEDWDGFLSTAQSEEYTACSVVIDGEAYKNVGIRGKGNTSLSTVATMNSDRYSFKIEFDQYDTGKTYYGLDKLSLNNLIQDTTYMKDYLTYRMMAEFGAAAPLCSYVQIRVNGEPWGLYLAVEGVEEAFLQRNYGNDFGELYKPDSMNFGGGRGNGKGFRMEDFMEQQEDSATSEGSQPPSAPDFRQGEMPDMDFSRGERPDMGGMGSSDVKLQYVDEDPNSYATIFDSAKTDLTAADQTRLIEALRLLSENDPEAALDLDAVLRYFVVHNFVVNADSYTGSMIHNYYLYEEDGKLSMLPWDYNLAFGTFQSGDANSAVNDDIDRPLSVTGSGDRPMADWIFQSETYTELYHQYFADFLRQVDAAAMVEETAALIAPYVEQDTTAFYTYEEFTTGTETLTQFCLLRTESVRNQLEGSDEPVDAGSLNLSAMGSMGGGFGGGFGGNPGSRGEGQFPEGTTMPEGMTMPWDSAGESSADASAPQSFRPDSLSVQNGNTASKGILLAVSAAVLILGLAFAMLYKRK